MERVYNKFGLFTLAGGVILLNLIYPKANIPMIVINLITCAIIGHAYYWLTKHYEELTYVSKFRQQLVKAAMYIETGQVIYRYTLHGDIDKFFLDDNDLDIWYGLNTPMRNRQFLYKRLSKTLKELSCKINYLDEE